MDAMFERTARVLPRQALERLMGAHVAVFGLGGVGGPLCEALARSGVGRLTIVDADTVEPTNLNRQIVALRSTIGKPKAEVMRARIADINPACRVEARTVFFLPENADSFDFSAFDYVADAVDTVAAKIEIVSRAKTAGVPVISAMGAGNKLDPTAFRVAELEKTRVCPLCRVMRRELRLRGISGVRVVYSEEEPVRAGGRTPGSVAFVPPVVGYIMAGEIIRGLCIGETE